MIGRVVGMAVLLSVLFVSMASGAAPEGPRLAFVRWTTQPSKLELLSIDAAGSGLRKIAGGNVGKKKMAKGAPTPFEGPTWSPDGTRIAYSGGFGKSRALWIGAPDGSGMRVVPGLKGATGPTFAPDGHTLAFSRTRARQHIDIKHPEKYRSYFSTSAWLIDLDTGTERQLTPWRNGLSNEPSSFSPDGSTLAMSHSDAETGDAVALKLTDGSTKVLASDAEQPVYSPDGSRIAFISYRDRNEIQGFDGPLPTGELYVSNVDGSGLRRLTRTIDKQESSPSWDPSGQRLAYTQSSDPEALGLDNVIMEINADGSCKKGIFDGPHEPKILGPGIYGPVWQPGPGREAGPIDCASR